MNIGKVNRLVFLLATLLLCSCVTTDDNVVIDKDDEYASEEIVSAFSNKSDETLALPSPALPEKITITPPKAAEKLYSFVARGLPLEQALRVFARSYRLNIITDKDVSGTLTAEFYDLPFDQAMEAMLSARGLYWQRDKNLISVKSWQTKSFTIDYIRTVRSGASSTQANVNSGISSSGGEEGGGGDTAGGIIIEQSDTVEFWQELEEQLAVLISDEGRLIVNRMAGTVQISDRHPRVEEVESYISQINQAVHRQVEIDIKIMEISLNDDFSLGVDWTRVADAAASGAKYNLGITNSIVQPAGGFAAQLPSLALNIFGTKGKASYTSVISALQEQGKVKTVSQPKIRTLNNQAAMVKVGTDRTFFRRELVTDTTSAGSTTISTDIPQLVTEGIVLAITPQVSTDGWIMMDVSPIVTRVSSISNILDSSGNVRSSAPNLDIRQASSLVRARDGETIVVGGLIQDQISDTERSVPILGSLPFIGKLFRGTYKAKVKKELVIFLTARVVGE